MIVCKDKMKSALAIENDQLKQSLAIYRDQSRITDGACVFARNALIAYCKIKSQKVVADKIGVTPQYLSDVIRMRRDLTVDLAERIIKIL